MKLKIGYITDERYPSVHTDTQQVIKTADALGAIGCEVDLIQPRMARHLFTPPKQRKADICRYYNVAGHFKLKDILLWPASDLRAEKFFHGVASPVKAVLGRYDVIYTRNLIPLRIATGLGGPVLFETYRALPKTNPRAWAAVTAAARTGKRFIGISTHSEYARETMVEAGVLPELVEAVPNGFDPSDFADIPDKVEARRCTDLPTGGSVAVYTGHIRADKGISSILDLAEDCPKTTVAVVGGNPEEVAALQTLCDERNLSNVRLTGQVNIGDVPLYLSAADVLLLPPTKAPLLRAGRTVLPMKTFTYLAGGRPIIAPDLPDTAGLLTNRTNCLKVEPDNRAAAANALNELLANPELAATLGRQAAKDSLEYTWLKRAERLVAFLTRRLAAMDGAPI